MKTAWNSSDLVILRSLVITSFCFLIGLIPAYSFADVTDVHGILPTPPSESLRSELGTVSVVSFLAQPAVHFVLAPASGTWGGFRQGAAVGGYIGCMFFLAAATTDITGLIFAIPGCIGGGMVGALSLGTYGAIAAEPSRTIEAVMTTVRNTLMSAEIHRRVQDRIRELMLVEKSIAQPAADNMATTRLETEVLSIMLDGLPPSAYSISEPRLDMNPSMRLIVTAQARLIRHQDEGELYIARFQYWGPTMTAAEWASNDAQLLRDEMDRATLALAEQIVDTVFLLYRAP